MKRQWNIDNSKRAASSFLNASFSYGLNKTSLIISATDTIFCSWKYIDPCLLPGALDVSKWSDITPLSLTPWVTTRIFQAAVSAELRILLHEFQPNQSWVSHNRNSISCVIGTLTNFLQSPHKKIVVSFPPSSMMKLQYFFKAKHGRKSFFWKSQNSLQETASLGF